MLGVRGQAHLVHYEERLRLVLSEDECRTALDLLTEAAVSEGRLHKDTVARYVERSGGVIGDEAVSITDVLYLLEHDGYVTAAGDGDYRFASGLLEEWWAARYGTHFVPIQDRSTSP